MPENVKLTVCDVDGTLLPRHEEKISLSVIRAVNSLADKGIVFAAASGRSVNSLKKIFDGAGNILLAGSDGAMLASGAGVLYCRSIEKQAIERILPKISGSFVLYTKSTAYVKGERIFEEVCKAEGGCAVDISEYSADIPVLKLAVFKDGEFEYAQRYALSNRLVRKCYEDISWCEYVAPGVDKGEAVRFLQEKYNIKYEETAALGDSHNDVEMLKNAYFSYAVGGARREIKTLARFYTESAEAQIKKIAEKCERR